MRRLADSPAHVDSGWLFVVAGLAMCAATILIPAQSGLYQLRRQLAELRDEEALLAARLRAHAAFLDDLQEAEPALVRRLAAAQLNLVPEGERPVLMVRSTSASVDDWIESTVRERPVDRSVRPASALSRLTEGQYRLWVLGGSIFCVFIGLLLGPIGSRRRFMEHRTPARGGGEARQRGDGSGVPRRKTAISDGSMLVCPAMPRAPATRPVALGADDAPAPESVAAPAPVAEAAVASREAEPGADDLLMLSEVEDEADVLDEDDVAVVAEDDDKVGDSAAETAGRADPPDTAAEVEAADPVVDGVKDDDEWEYEDAASPQEADEAGHDDDDDEYEYEYEYEYIYVDEDEGDDEEEKEE
jgi:hypothetical protein